MSLWTSLEPVSAAVDPGGTATVRLRLRNTGDVVDEYRFEPVGDIAPWTTVEPQTLRLFPGTTGTVELTFAPPRTPDATAGPNAYAVRITPTEHPEAATVPEGNLTITPFTEVRAELVPPTVKGRLRGRPKLAIDNLGNTKVTASVSGSDNGDQLSYDIFPSNVRIEPGRAAFVKATLKPRQITWFGSKQERPYLLAVKRSGVTPLDVEGMYVQRSFLPGWLATCLGILLALAVTFLTMWFAFRPQVVSAAGEYREAGVSTLPPSASPQPLESVRPEPEKDAEPEPDAAPSEEEADGGGGGGGGGAPEASSEPVEEEDESVLPARNVLLRNLATKLCADVPGEGNGRRDGRVQQFTCDDSTTDNQLWHLEVKVEKQAPDGTDLFQIRNAKDQLCMDLPNYGANPIHTKITEFTCDGTTSDNQLWWLDPQQSGGYWIRNYASDNKCLEVAGNEDLRNEVTLMLFHCTVTDDQEWQIVPAEGI
ncbi:hydrogenase expression protein [Streptomyces phaeolivaceus]|uniref:Hydrogenase expression protein n=1 Tax=Streptomyces phaeolivaceus TaxID=2653200 RepID=A0A5P8KAT7_9ACTN|nr:RICIN domain-containing protein [Streptomyces phaeolivaceus]QFR00434.1 hydrogenase expression protein [Streptomyces phaeolivaceus]